MHTRLTTRLRARACKHGKNCVTCVKRCAGSNAPRAIRWPLDPVPNASMGSVSTCIGNCTWLFLGYRLRHNTTAQWSTHDALRPRAVMTLTAGAACSLRYLICCLDRTDCTAAAATTAWAKRPRVACSMRPRAGQKFASVTAIRAANAQGRDSSWPSNIYMKRGTEKKMGCKYVDLADVKPATVTHTTAT